MSDKIKSVRDFSREFELLLETERNDFSRLVNRLLKETFILKDREADRADYFKIVGKLPLYKPFFEIIDYDFISDGNNNIFYIKTSQDRNRISLLKFDTVMLLILRRLYTLKSKEITSTNETMVTLEEIKDQLRTSQVYKDDKKISNYDASLRLLRRYKIVDFATTKLEDDTKIQIYPTIHLLIPQDSIEELTIKLNALRKEDEGGASNEDFDED